MTTPAQERAVRSFVGDDGAIDLDEEGQVRAVLSAALDEAEMLEAIRNAPCVYVRWCVTCEDGDTAGTHPECAARAVLELVLGGAA